MSTLDSIERALAPATSRVTRFVGRHPRTLTSVLVAGLMGFGVAAFGIAPMAPDAADLPRRLVTEIVTPDDVNAQLEALASHASRFYRTDVTRSGDTADSLLSRLSVSDARAAAFLRSDPVARKLLEGRAGKMVQVSTTDTGALEELLARYPAEDASRYGTHFSRLRITSADGGLSAIVETAELSTEVRLGSGTVNSSLFAATDEARIPDPVAIQIAEIFSTDIDFRRELRKGDTFTVVYEALTADGEPVAWNQASGRVLAAEFVNNGRTYSAVWFQDASTKGGYYGFDGESKRRTFLASPLEFSRVTSGFAMRMHPILKSVRAHRGVDYGAPTGTPVRAVGEGTVDFAGWQNGYGNVIKIRHSNNRTTLYAHLSRIDVRRGQRVDQGSRIGAVGATGWATGPHLHFEFHVNGEHRNPMIMAQSSEAVALAPASRPTFDVAAKQLRMQLDLASDNIQHLAGSFE